MAPGIVRLAALVDRSCAWAPITPTAANTRLVVKNRQLFFIFSSAAVEASGRPSIGAVLEIATPFFAARRNGDRRTTNMAFTGVGVLVNFVQASAPVADDREPR